MFFRKLIFGGVLALFMIGGSGCNFQADINTIPTEEALPAETSNESSATPPSQILSKPTVVAPITATPTIPSSQVGTDLPPIATQPTGFKDLSIGYAFSPEYADYFNKISVPTDFTAVGLPGLENLAGAGEPQKVLMFSSLERLLAYPPEVFNQVDLIGFDLERGAVPSEEQADLVATVSQASEFAKSHNLKLLLAPVARWTEEYGSQFAPFADVIVMQMMRYQDNPELFASQVHEYASQIRTANPEILVFAQVSTQREQTPEDLYDSIQAAQADLDGIWIQWHYRESGSGPKGGDPNIEEVQRLIELIRGPS